MIKYLVSVRFNWLDIVFVMAMSMMNGVVGHNVFFVLIASIIWFTLSEWIKLKVNKESV